MSFNPVSSEQFDQLTGEFFATLISKTNLESLSSGDEVFYKSSLLSGLGRNASADLDAVAFYYTPSYRVDGEHLFVAVTSAKVVPAA